MTGRRAVRPNPMSSGRLRPVVVVMLPGLPGIGRIAAISDDIGRHHLNLDAFDRSEARFRTGSMRKGVGRNIAKFGCLGGWWGASAKDWPGAHQSGDFLEIQPVVQNDDALCLIGG